jgi:hypothetical protein
MSENPSLDDENINKDAEQFKRQSLAKTIALLRRERLMIEERLKEIDIEIERLSKQDG